MKKLVTSQEKAHPIAASDDCRGLRDYTYLSRISKETFWPETRSPFEKKTAVKREKTHWKKEINLPGKEMF